MNRNGGAAVVETLAAHGVDTVFGIPGTHNLELYRHLSKNGIRAITPRHEQGAGYAAGAYAWVTGRAGVVITTSGPGLTNAMTAASTAYAESQPLLVISPGMPTGTEGRDLGQLHEAKNTSAAMDQLVHWSRRVRSAEEAAAAVADAFAGFAAGRPPAGAHRDPGRRPRATVDRYAAYTRRRHRGRGRLRLRATRRRGAQQGSTSTPRRRRGSGRRAGRGDRAG